jgi:hypothetical protein
MYGRYKSHNDATFSYMEDAFCCNLTFPDVFLLGRAGKQAKAKSNAVRMELVKKRSVDKKTHAEIWTPSTMLHKLNAWWDDMNNTIDVPKQLDADVNSPKIHLMSHRV